MTAGPGQQKGGWGDKSIPLSSEDFNPWPLGKDQLLTYISASQSQNTSIAAAEHAADDITQDACTHLGLGGENKGQRASYDPSEGARPVKPEQMGGARADPSRAQILYARGGKSLTDSVSDQFSGHRGADKPGLTTEEELFTEIVLCLIQTVVRYVCGHYLRLSC